MSGVPKLVISVVGAGALVGSLVTNAIASQPGRPPADKKYTLNGSYTITGVARILKNNSVYGHLYAHNNFQVWKSILVHDGGIKVNAGGVSTDALSVSGSSQLSSATVANNLQAGSITTTGTATVGGKLTANGLDAMTGGLTTTGAISGGAITGTSLASTGGITTTSLTDTGALAAGAATLGSLNVSGNTVYKGSVDFTGATVSGLSLTNFGGSLASLSLGSNGSQSPPLSLTEKGQTATIGVNSNGAVEVNNLNVTGTLTYSNSNGLTVSAITAPVASGTSAPGALTLTGSTINLAGNTTLTNGSDLTFSTSGSNRTHLLAAGDADVAGTRTVNISSGTTAGAVVTQDVSFDQAYATQPVVVLTPAGDPEPGGNGAPKVWVTLNSSTSSGTTTYTGFRINYAPEGSAVNTNSYSVTFNYHVIGQ